VRKLRDLGVQVWIIPSPTQRVNIGEFRRRCIDEKISGIFIEGGSQLISELIQLRELDYLMVYRSPMLFADDRAKSAFSGLRTERLGNAVRLRDVRQETFGDDFLTRGHIVYPETMYVDETVFCLG
jgi:diaminohydroxyphosphoribosylaminopyrimidine deaminase/5-amino-6-(5-phosphoribosylamino)uracil reductase